MSKSPEIRVKDIELDELIGFWRIVQEDLEGALALLEDEKRECWNMHELRDPEEPSQFLESLTKVFDLRGKRKISKVELENTITAIKKKLQGLEDLRERDPKKMDVRLTLKSTKRKLRYRLLSLLLLPPDLVLSKLQPQLRERLRQLLAQFCSSQH